ncbi:uncharacterized protein DS421_14g451950 [Arachis hypogaea]|nr:uncharacterized protein DS421_14g451950 [Arachis hypogaea]
MNVAGKIMRLPSDDASISPFRIASFRPLYISALNSLCFEYTNLSLEASTIENASTKNR